MTRAFHAGSLSHENTSDRRSNAESDGAGDTTAITSPSPQGKAPASGGSEGSSKPRSSSGLGCRPFTAVAAVQIRSGVPTEKRCPRCDQTLPLEAFNRSSGRRDGRQGTCRECYRTKIHREPKHQARARERSLAYTQNNPEKRKAQRKLNYQIESGKMIRGFCECCGTEKADAHHWKGYDHPLDVQWLCRSCHVTLEPRRGVAA